MTQAQPAQARISPYLYYEDVGAALQWYFAQPVASRG